MVLFYAGHASEDPPPLPHVAERQPKNKIRTHLYAYIYVFLSLYIYTRVEKWESLSGLCASFVDVLCVLHLCPYACARVFFLCAYLCVCTLFDVHP